MNEIRQHVPSFFPDIEPKTVGFDTIEQLLEIPFVKNFAKDARGWKFYRYSLSPDIGALLSEYDNGQHWLVVGFIRDPLPEGAFPIWSKPTIN